LGDIVEDQARTAIRAQGARVTAARVNVLATLMRSSSALSHQELLDRLSPATSIDRVTAYRVLEWLVQSGLAHRIAGEDRVWRFSVGQPCGHDCEAGPAHQHTHHEAHGHFQCDACNRMFCIDAPVGTQENLARLPEGFDGRDVEVLVRGLCPSCRT